jgi:hypothetical protein
MAELSEGPKDESPEGVTAKAARFFRTFGFIDCSLATVTLAMKMNRGTVI